MTVMHLIGLILFFCGIVAVKPHGVVQKIGVAMIAIGWLHFHPYIESVLP